ncbi:MAG: alpha/beta hydrolase [Planctomycetales bacterium]|nr:alpha/beta hydrolase [Planctomycetales bacterium]
MEATSLTLTSYDLNGQRRLRHLARWWVAALLMTLTIHVGCSNQRYLIRRETPANPLAAQLQINSKSGPVLDARTQSLLRRYALHDSYQQSPRQCLEELHVLVDNEPSGELVYAIAELAYILGKSAQQAGDAPEALDMYGVAVSNAYMFLFSKEFDPIRNPYDPQFRGACDIYNQSLESSLRLVNATGELKPGYSYRLTTGTTTYEVPCRVRGKWSNNDFERFEFVSDYALDGLPASGLTYGLGVPLIAVRKQGDPNDPREQYYPDGLSFPVTALLRVVNPNEATCSAANHRHHCVLELHDPLDSCDLSLGGRLVPLQTDLSTSLAYFLDSPQFREKDQATLGLLDPQRTLKDRGVYMLEPFDPRRIPVVMVHGLWSSPVTWMPMFNDLRSFRELRENYQFWFYQYPTGQPFWNSATQMRQDLNELRDQLDPDRRYQALDYTVLVGHSMGGLLSRMQTVDSQEQFWNILSDEPFEAVKGSPENINMLRKAAFFTASRDIKRVVTIGTPFRGSERASDATRWLARKLIRLPTMMVATATDLVNHNPGVFQNADLLINSTSIDSLSPDSPVFPALLRAPRAPWVEYHNIVGKLPDQDGWFWDVQPTGDGVVDLSSAHMDDVATEIVVPAEHQTIHRHPKTILEVRRILREHLHAVQAEYRIAQRLADNPARQSTLTQAANEVPIVPASSVEYDAPLLR